MKHILVLIIIFSSFYISAQETFVKIYDDLDNEGRQIRQVVEKDGRFFTLSTGNCSPNLECSLLMEIDEYGNVIWEKTMRWLDVAKYTMVISSDTIVIAGNNNPFQEEFFLHFRSMDGDSLKTYTVSDPNQPKTRMFILGLQEFDNKYILSGTGRDSMRSSLIYSVHKDGSLDTLLSIDRSDANSTAYGISVDDDELLNVIIEVNSTEQPSDTKDFRKYDKDWNIVWNFKSEPLFGSYKTSKTMVDMEDGAIIYPNWVTFSGDVLYKVDKDKNVLWTYDFESSSQRVAGIYRLERALDGNILGVGSWIDYTEEEFDYLLDRVPFIFKMSADGEMIWRKTIVKQDTSLFERAIFGYFFDVEELDNGDLIAVGEWGENPFMQPVRRLAVRLDSDGCVLDECGEYFTFTDIEDIVLPYDISIYPNPVSAGYLQVDGLLASSKYHYSIFDNSGVLVLSGEIGNVKAKLDIGNFPVGNYYLRIHDDRSRFKTLKFVKI